MHTELVSIVLVVFAGGPHTASRAALAERDLATLGPQLIYLTGAEFTADARPTQDHLRQLAARQVTAPPVWVDASHSTVASCLSVRSLLRRQYPQGASVIVITSDYHAPRLRWLLRPLLPRRYALSLRTSPDIPLREALATPLNRRLMAGEVVSWLYCLPLGLLLRPVAITLAAMGALLAVLFWRHRRSIRQPSPTL